MSATKSTRCVPRSRIAAPRRQILRGVVEIMGSRILDALFDARSPLPYLTPPPAGKRLVVLPAPGQLAPGNQSIIGLAHLVALAQALDSERIFEFGTYNGLTALTLAANLPTATIDTLDLPAATRPALPIAESDHDHIGMDVHLYEGTPESSRITQHLEDSARFDFSRFGRVFDLVYVDGAHSPEYVRSDTDAAFRIVKEGGVVVWDDYTRFVPGVPNYLDTIRHRGLFRLSGSRLVAWFGERAWRRIENLMVT